MAEGPGLVFGSIVFPLSRLTSRVGRRDREAAINPDIDLEAVDTSRLVSRRHAEIRYRDGEMHLVDVGASNGVLVNGVRLAPATERALRDGDALTFGGVTLHFESQVAWPEGLVAEWAADATPAAEPVDLVHTKIRPQGSLVTQLEEAIAGNQMLLYFMPKVELASGRTHGVEGLVRWDHPQLGILGPGSFIPLAEEMGLIRALTDVAFAAAMRQAREWMEEGIDLVVGVNMTTQDLEDGELATRVGEQLEEQQIPPDRFQAELTETGLMRHPERAIDVLRRLRELGIKLAVDDFGMGQSSLGYLKQLPATEIKIDQSFFQNLGREDVVIIRSAAEMGHQLDMVVTAEGIETEEAATMARELGCDVGQGYYFGRPVPAAEITARLKAEP